MAQDYFWQVDFICLDRDENNHLKMGPNGDALVDTWDERDGKHRWEDVKLQGTCIPSIRLFGAKPIEIDTERMRVDGKSVEIIYGIEGKRQVLFPMQITKLLHWKEAHLDIPMGGGGKASEGTIDAYVMGAEFEVRDQKVQALFRVEGGGVFLHVDGDTPGLVVLVGGDEVPHEVREIEGRWVRRARIA